MNQEIKPAVFQETTNKNQVVYGFDQMPEDEIDLAELIGVLFRKKWFIVGFTFLITCIAFGFTQILPEKYNVSTLVEIGQISRKDGGTEVIETMAFVKNRLESSAKITVIQMMNDKQNEKKSDLGFSEKKNFKIDIPKQGKILTLSLETGNTANGVDFMSKVIDNLIKNHEKIQDQKKNKIKQEIRVEKNRFLDLDYKIQVILSSLNKLSRDYKNKTISSENLVAAMYNNISNIESQKKFQKQKIVYLEKEKAELLLQIKNAEQRDNILFESKLKAGSQAKEEGAISLILFNNEVQHIQSYLSQMRERLFSKIPERISEIQVLLDKLDKDILEIKADINLEQQNIKQLKPELQGEIDKLNRELDSFKNQKKDINKYIEELNQNLNNMIQTRNILEPQISEKPVSPKVKMIVALGFAAGLFVSVFAAFLLEFWTKNREKIMGYS